MAKTDAEKAGYFAPGAGLTEADFALVKQAMAGDHDVDLTEINFRKLLSSWAHNLGTIVESKDKDGNTYRHRVVSNQDHQLRMLAAKCLTALFIAKRKDEPPAPKTLVVDGMEEGMANLTGMPVNQKEPM
jgi:hypothetical protein